jgi:hypothetical protein
LAKVRAVYVVLKKYLNQFHPQPHSHAAVRLAQVAVNVLADVVRYKMDVSLGQDKSMAHFPNIVIVDGSESVHRIVIQQNQ